MCIVFFLRKFLSDSNKSLTFGKRFYSTVKEIPCKGKRIITNNQINNHFLMLDNINLPPYNISIRQENGEKQIFDILRRKHVSLTPEEWVRQHFVHYLIEHKGYPMALMQNEVQLRCGQKRLRCDSILYRSDGSARMILEYKAPSVAITQKVIEQIAAYNILLHVDYLIVSNGNNHYCFKTDYEQKRFVLLDEIPDYKQLSP